MSDLTRKAVTPARTVLCIGCDLPVSIIVSFRHGEGICRPCADKAVGIFKANAAKVRDLNRQLRASGTPIVKGGPLRARHKRQRVTP